MDKYLYYKYAKDYETKVYKNLVNGKGKSLHNHILRGTWTGVVEENGDWYRVITAGENGWVHKNSVSDDMGLKLFFVDVGQGDGLLLEIGNEKIIVDGGPNDNFKNYLEWKYSYLLENGKTVYISKLFISHFDADHYKGIIDLLNNPAFSFGTIYHNGIARFNKKSKRPSKYNEDLGIMENKYLLTSFNSFSDLQKLQQKGGFQYTFYLFYKAVNNAKSQGRLKKIERLTNESTIKAKTVNRQRFKINVLGPVMSKHNSSESFKWFKDSSHTRNGHSLVLKIEYSGCSMLLGGDLNTCAERHLMKHYANKNPFEVDVAKSCHHGASEFLDKFMAKINPFATVISSGDNENYAHPRADAIGCAGKYARGKRPLVFSTELARSVKSSGDIVYGMINLRCDGQDIVMAQMKEKRSKGSIWDSYIIKPHTQLKSTPPG